MPNSDSSSLLQSTLPGSVIIAATLYSQLHQQEYNPQTEDCLLYSCPPSLLASRSIFSALSPRMCLHDTSVSIQVARLLSFADSFRFATHLHINRASSPSSSSSGVAVDEDIINLLNKMDVVRSFSVKRVPLDCSLFFHIATTPKFIHLQSLHIDFASITSRSRAENLTQTLYYLLNDEEGDEKTAKFLTPSVVRQICDSFSSCTPEGINPTKILQLLLRRLQNPKESVLNLAAFIRCVRAIVTTRSYLFSNFDARDHAEQVMHIAIAPFILYSGDDTFPATKAAWDFLASWTDKRDVASILLADDNLSLLEDIIAEVKAVCRSDDTALLLRQQLEAKTTSLVALPNVSRIHLFFSMIRMMGNFSAFGDLLMDERLAEMDILQIDLNILSVSISSSSLSPSYTFVTSKLKAIKELTEWNLARKETAKSENTVDDDDDDDDNGTKRNLEAAAEFDWRDAPSWFSLNEFHKKLIKEVLWSLSNFLSLPDMRVSPLLFGSSTTTANRDHQDDQIGGGGGELMQILLEYVALCGHRAMPKELTSEARYVLGSIFSSHTYDQYRSLMRAGAIEALFLFLKADKEDPRRDCVNIVTSIANALEGMSASMKDVVLERILAVPDGYETLQDFVDRFGELNDWASDQMLKLMKMLDRKLGVGCGDDDDDDDDDDGDDDDE